jgi:hypothetical protein
VVFQRSPSEQLIGTFRFWFYFELGASLIPP